MKVSYLHFYQAVTMHDGKRRKVVTHLRQQDGVDMEILPSIGVRARTEFDDCIITFNNISYMNPISEVKKTKASKGE